MCSHTSSTYNNSLLTVPRNPTVGLPLPSYEQNYKYHLENQSRTLNNISMEGKKYLDKETTKSFVEFFSNIPDYDEVHHLSNKEFYKQLENLKEKKKMFEENLHKEIKFDPQNSNVIEEYKKEKLGANKNREKKKPALKQFRATQVKKTLTPDLDSEFSDKEENKEKRKSSLKPYYNVLSKNLHPAITPDMDSEFSDKDISNKPPSRRSVRIETPSDRFSNDETPEPYLRSKSRANMSSHQLKRSLSLSGSEDSRSKSRTHFSSLDEKNNRSTNDWDGMKFKPMVNYSSQDFKDGNSTDWEDLKSKSKGSYLKSTGNISDWEDYKPRSAADFKSSEWNEKSKTRSSESNKSNNKSVDINSDMEGLRGKYRNDFKTSGNLTDWEDLSIENLNLNSISNSPEPLETRSAPTSPVKLNPKSNWIDKGITIPKPFQMTVRDEENKIVEELYFKMKKPKDEKPEMFKAHEIPIESQIPLFDKIMADQQRRSFIAKHKRKESLRAQMKPFSFTKRDEEIQELNRELSKSSPNLYSDPPLRIKKFRAKPIPKNLFSNYIYRKMHEDEYYRALQKKIRAEEMLKAASLPPSMAKREKTLTKINVCPRSFSTLPKEEKIKKSRNIPNYKAYHDKFEKELEDIKNEFVTTSPRPFKLKTSKRARRQFRHSSASSKSSSSKTVTPCSLDISSINTSNLAAILRIQSARQKIEMEMYRKLEESQRRDEARWREKLFRKKPVWHNLDYSHEDDLAMRLQLRRDEERLRNEEHKMRMMLMYGRVQKQPTLFERQSQMKYPITREELEDQLREIYGKKKNQSVRSISNLSGKKSAAERDSNFNLDLEDTDRSKEKESSEEKEKCDCLSDDIDNDNSNEKLG